jgi:hypothetical protein
MTSARQIEANRANALSSTGPKSDPGKQRASQNAIRHGLTAETVILPLEDPDDYMAFEQAVTADYEAETAVERELVLRLASLLWRLRRATSIESGLLQIQEEFLPEPLRAAQSEPSRLRGLSTIFRQPIGDQSDDANKTSSTSSDVGRDLARRFMRLADLDNGVFERLGRYEASLWRQVRQTLFTLEGLRWRTSRARAWRTQRTMVSEADW